MDKKKIVYWSASECMSADLHCGDMDEAIEEIIDEMIREHDIESKEPFALPETLVLRGFEFEELIVPPVLNELICYLDDTHKINCDVPRTEISPEMRKAEQRFLATILKMYKPCFCTEICRKTINVEEWARECATTGRPDLYVTYYCSKRTPE